MRNPPISVENTVVSKVGKTISAGATLCKAVRTAIIDVGTSCKDVAFKTNSIADEYSAFGLLSKSCAAFIPYGVAAPPRPKRLDDKFIEIAVSVSVSSV